MAPAVSATEGSAVCYIKATCIYYPPSSIFQMLAREVGLLLCETRIYINSVILRFSISEWPKDFRRSQTNLEENRYISGKKVEKSLRYKMVPILQHIYHHLAKSKHPST